MGRAGPAVSACALACLGAPEHGGAGRAGTHGKGGAGEAARRGRGQLWCRRGAGARQQRSTAQQRGGEAGHDVRRATTPLEIEREIS